MEVNQWFYAESACDPVDYYSLSLKALDKLSLRSNWPGFLLDSEKHWPLLPELEVFDEKLEKERTLVNIQIVQFSVLLNQLF